MIVLQVSVGGGVAWEHWNNAFLDPGVLSCSRTLGALDGPAPSSAPRRVHNAACAGREVNEMHSGGRDGVAMIPVGAVHRESCL
jgi:hypothetical protein